MSAIEIPGYKIIKTLGVGGQATVYLAIQQGFDREVALKIMSPALAADPTFGERFLREAKIVAKLSHARIVTVYDVGESGNFYYLAMEYMRGEELKSQIAKGLKTKQALVIIARLAQALHFAHKKGYIHRDVKSENILFDDDNQPVLTDFGIAKASNSSTQMTQTGKLIGTPEYMSPEQCRGRKLDGRSDLYSLGIILFEMLARKVPFTGEDSVSVCIQHVTKPVPQLPARLGHLQWIIELLLAKKASNRFQTGKEVSEAIQSFLKDGQRASVRISTESEKNATRTDIDIPSDGFDEQSFELNDNFEINRRIEVMPESSGLISKIVFALLFIIAIGAGYQFRTDWIPEAQQLLGVNWFDSKELAPSGSQTKKQIEMQSVEKLASDKKTRVLSQELASKPSQSESAANSTTNSQVADLVQKASTLAQYVPHELSDIKQALDNLTRAKSIAPTNEQIGEVKQTIIRIALRETDNFSEQNKHKIAEQWLELVESADYFNEDLSTLKATIAARKYAYFQEISNDQKNEKRLSSLLSDANLAIEQNRLSAPLKKNALYFLREATIIDPDSRAILSLSKRMEDKYVSLIQGAIKTREFAKANRYLSKLTNLPSPSSDYSSLTSTLRKEKLKFDKIQAEKQRLQTIEQDKKIKAEKRNVKLANPLTQMQLLSKLQSAADLLRMGNLVQPLGNNALEKYQAALEIDPLDETAIQGIKNIESTIITNLEVAISNSLIEPAKQWLSKLKLFDASDPRIDGYALQVEEIIASNILQQDNVEANLDDLGNDDASVMIDSEANANTATLGDQSILDNSSDVSPEQTGTATDDFN